MNKDTYIIGAGLNYETKVNLNYKKWYMLNFVCAEHIMQLLDDSRAKKFNILKYLPVYSENDPVSEYPARKKTNPF